MTQLITHYKHRGTSKLFRDEFHNKIFIDRIYLLKIMDSPEIANN